MGGFLQDLTGQRKTRGAYLLEPINYYRPKAGPISEQKNWKGVKRFRLGEVVTTSLRHKSYTEVSVKLHF